MAYIFAITFANSSRVLLFFSACSSTSIFLMYKDHRLPYIHTHIFFFLFPILLIRSRHHMNLYFLRLFTFTFLLLIISYLLLLSEVTKLDKCGGDRRTLLSNGDPLARRSLRLTAVDDQFLVRHVSLLIVYRRAARHSRNKSYLEPFPFLFSF